MRFRILLLLTLLLTAPIYPAHSQEIVLPKQSQALLKAIPDSMLYGVLFRQAASFYHQAAVLDEAGKDGSPWRRHLAHKLGLSASEELALEEASLVYLDRVGPIDAEIASSAARWRAGLGAVPAGYFPPLPPEAKGLQIKREAAIQEVRDYFHASVGDSEFARIDSLVKTRLSVGIHPQTTR